MIGKTERLNGRQYSLIDYWNQKTSHQVGK